jgi:actin-related protein
MDLLKKMRSGSEHEDLAVPTSYPEGERGEEMGMGNSTEEELFEDDKEMDRVRGWWLQSDVTEVMAEELKEEDLKEELKEEDLKEELKEEDLKEELKEEDLKEETEKESDEDKDELIDSLREDLSVEEQEETNIVLKEAMEEMGNVSAAELLELGVATLRELTERTT